MGCELHFQVAHLSAPCARGRGAARPARLSHLLQPSGVVPSDTLICAGEAGLAEAGCPEARAEPPQSSSAAGPFFIHMSSPRVGRLWEAVKVAAASSMNSHNVDPGPGSCGSSAHVCTDGRIDGWVEGSVSGRAGGLFLPWACPLHILQGPTLYFCFQAHPSLPLLPGVWFLCTLRMCHLCFLGRPPPWEPLGWSYLAGVGGGVPCTQCWAGTGA